MEGIKKNTTFAASNQNKPLMDEKSIINETVDRKEFGLVLKTWRLRHALTQREVGQMFGVSRYTIMRAESAKEITWMMAYRIFVKLSAELKKEANNEDVC